MCAYRGEHEKLFDGVLTDDLPSIVAAAHELKSPLALVRQLSIALQSGDFSSAEKKQMQRQISLTAERALRLTSDLTKSVRMSDAMFDLEPINPRQLCEDAVRELRPLFKAHDREIKLSCSRSSLLAVANRDLLRRVIVNFGDNALHYTEKGGVVEIRIFSIDYGRRIRLGVRDHGPAISREAFKKFTKKISATPSVIHSRPQGSGLGLYIAKLFADAMEGSIGMTRHRDGATFFIDLQASKQLSLL